MREDVAFPTAPVREVMAEPHISSREIYYTNDYGMFGWIPGNRLLEERRITKICKIYNEGINLFPYVPILVTQAHKVIDGQHRLMAAKKLKTLIYFMYVDDYDVAQIAKINSSTGIWKSKDYMNCWINLDKQDYCDLENFIKDYHIPISASIQLLMEGIIRTGGGQMEAFREGKFKINHRESALKIARMYNDYLDISVMNKSRLLLLAVNTLASSDKYNHDEVIQKITTTGAKIELQDSAREFISHIEMLYNKGSHKRKLII